MKPLSAITPDTASPAALDAEAPPTAAPTLGLGRRVASGASWSLLDNASQQVLSLMIFVVLGRLLSPALFGVVSTAMVFVFFMRSTVLNAISTGLVALKAPIDEDYDTGFWLCIAISSLALLILNVAAQPLARLYHIEAFASVIRATSVIVLLSGLSYAHVGWARRNFWFRSLAMRNTISTGVAGAIGIGVALVGYGLIALVLNQVIAAVLGLALLWRAIPWRPRLRFSRPRAGAIMGTALPLGANQSLQFLAQNVDTALVTYVLGPFGGGLYAAAKRVVLAVQIALWQPIASVTLPAFAEVKGEPARFGNAAVRMGSVVMTVTAPLFAGIALTAPSSVQVLFGHKWDGAAPIMTVLAGFGVLTPSLGLLQQMLVALGRAKWVLMTTVTQLLLALGAIAVVGAGAAPTTVAFCLSAPLLVSVAVTLTMLSMSDSFPLGRYLLGVSRPLACVTLMAAAVMVVPDLRAGPLAQLLALVTIGGLTYAAAALVIARPAFHELLGLARGALPKRVRAKLGSA